MNTPRIQQAIAWQEISTHLHVYRSLLEDAKKDAAPAHPGDIDNAAYYQHELDALQNCIEIANGDKTIPSYYGDPEQGLINKVAELEATLEPLLIKQHEELVFEAKQARIKDIVNLLFPAYSVSFVRSNPDLKPLCHPEKSWWWNGATIEEMWDTNHGTTVQLKSYVGGSNHDDYQLSIPIAWLEAENYTEIIIKWIDEQSKELLQKQKADELSKAMHDLESASNRVAELKSKQE